MSTCQLITTKAVDLHHTLQKMTSKMTDLAPKASFELVSFSVSNADHNISRIDKGQSKVYKENYIGTLLIQSGPRKFGRINRVAVLTG